MKSKLKIFILLLAGAALTSGCYTSFTHPLVDSQGKRINRSNSGIAGSCSECHADGTLQAGSVLPAAVENDYDWQFYTNSAWWQDEFDFFPVNATESADPTGARLPGVTPGYSSDAITPIPVMPSQSGLSKKTPENTTQTEQTDNRRDFERRKDTQSTDDKARGNDKSTRDR
ncbi:MAG TPA: hypothetical protein PLP19_13520 [bacterium]|nr:hypothetical protein [bacterium]HPN44506.1 hypothetical protein [bacterium]